MARLGTVRLGFALAILTLIQYTTSEGTCRSGCIGSHHTFKYEEGTTYKYNLEGNIDISLSTAEGQHSSTKLKATVLLTQLPQCNQLLKLQHVQIIGPDSKKYGHIPNIEKPVQINFHDGHIEDIICAEPGDTQNSLNIKRAVASLFQANEKHHYETDVFGFCPTDVSSKKEGPNFVIHKSRHLNKCAHRESMKQDFMATSFNLNSEIKSSPILNGEYTSEQKIKNGILDYAAVNENYLYMPFSIGKDGAKATVFTKIHFIGTSKDAPHSKVSIPKSIIFENPHIVTTHENNVNDILTALKETKDTINTVVGESSAKHFINLVKIVRVSKKDDLLAVYGQVRAGAGFKDKVGAKQVFLDALFHAGTGEAVEVGIELLKNKELSPIEQKLVYLGLSFVKHATTDSIIAAASLLDQPHLPREAYLGVGAIAGRYCREHSCQKVEAIKTVTTKLLSKLGDGKADNRNRENEVISVLKALGNIGILSDGAVAKIVSIAQDKKAANRIRVTALETYLADACKDKLRDSALHILKDIQQDSEIRIKAYLAVAQCPNGKIANALKTILDNEPSYQVGGFIVSHIRNLRASANSDKEHAKQQLGQISTTKKFPIDLRKYSFNNEFSYTVDTAGVASTVESNVIYSQNSFLPRSSNLNLTTEIFGHTFNFLEIGLRQENLDKVIEHYLGPLGVFNSVSPDKVVATGKESVDTIRRRIRERLHKTVAKRDVSKGEIEHIAKQVQIKTNELNTDLDLDLSVKIFGSELLFLSIFDQNENFSPDAMVDKLFDSIDNGVNAVKAFEKSIQSNSLFIDSELSYPTSLGFPLRLTVEGSSSVQLKAAGKVDVLSFLPSHESSVPFKLSLIPSANIDIIGSMTVDTQVIQSGLKITSSMYSATGGDLEVVETNKNDLDIRFSLPVEQQKLISASHEIVFNTRESGKSEVDHPIKFGQYKDFSVCMDQLSPVIGLAFCVDINSPPTTSKHGTVLPFPLSGNAKFSVGIQREDVSEYHFKRVIFDSQHKLAVKYLLETIGQNKDKKLSVEAEVSIYPEMFIKGTLASPITSATVEGRVVNNDQEKSISLHLDQDQNKYMGKIGLGISGGGDKYVLKPFLQYHGPGPHGQPLPFNVEGSIIVENHGSQLSFDHLALVSSDQKRIGVDGILKVERDSIFSDLHIAAGQHSGAVKGKVQYQPNNLNVNAEIKNTFNPELNMHIKYDFKRSPSQVDSNLELIHGSDLSSKVNKLTIINIFMYKHHSKHHSEAVGKNKVSYPALHIDSKFDYAVSPKKISYDLEYKYGKHEFGSELDAKVSQKVPGDYDVDFEIYDSRNKLEIELKREIIGEKSKVHNSLEINGKKFGVSGTITHHYKHEDINIGADLVIKIADYSEPIKIQNGLILNPGELDTHLKISAGNNVYVDVFLKGSKEGNANGNLNINLKHVLVANGQLRVANGVGNAYIVIELPKAHRKVKTETTFTIASPTYNVIATFYPDYERDNNRKLILSTHNQIHHNSIDSKNFIEHSSKKLELNFKGSLDGHLNNGKLESEAEIIFPNNLYFTTKLDREVHIVNGIINGQAMLILEQRDNKNSPGRKIIIKGAVKDGHLEKKLFDISYNIIIDNGNGKTLNTDISLQRLLHGDHHQVDGKVKIHGNVLAQPIEVNANAMYKDNIGSYKIESKFGPTGVININGKYDGQFEDDHEIHGDIDVYFVTPNSGSNTLKFSASGLIGKPEDHLKLKGSAELTLESKTNPKANMNGKVTGEAVVSPNKGHINVVIQVPHKPPVKVEVGYGRTKNEYKGDLKLHYGNVPDSRLQIQTKKSDDGKTISSEIIAETNNLKYILKNELSLSELSPMFDISLTLPDGKVDRIYAKLDKPSPKQLNGEVKIVFTEINFVLDSSIQAHIDNVDDFAIKIFANSPSLKIDHVELEAQNKPAKGGKRIQIIAKSAGKNLLSGSTSYKAREEGGKLIVEGSGAVKYKEENKQANFKFATQKLTTAKNGEEGIEMSLNAGLGNKAVDAELKITDKHYRMLNSYCEEKQQCAHIEMDSKINKAAAGEFHHEIEIAVDLRKLGLSHEFGLKGVTNRKSFILDHTVDIYFQNKENKYQYSLYVHPNEAGAQLTTPKRVIALEGSVQIPRQRNAPVKGEIALYLNKKHQPNQKTALVGFIHCNQEDGSNRCTGEVKLTNPALEKDLCITYDMIDTVKSESVTRTFNSVIDIFPNANNKIVISGEGRGMNVGRSGVAAIASLEVKSEGLKIYAKYKEEFAYDPTKYDLKYTYAVNYHVLDSKYDSAIEFLANPQRASAHVKIWNKDILNANSRFQIGRDNLVSSTDIHVLGVEPVTTHLEVQGNSNLKYTISRRGNPNNKLQITSTVSPSHVADFRMEIIRDGASHPLIYSAVKLDAAHFLKTTYDINSANIQKYLVATLQNDAKSFLKELKVIYEATAKDVNSQAERLAQHIKQNLPNIKPLRDYYQRELHKIKEELESDKTLQNVGKFLRVIFDTVIRVVGKQVSIVGHIAEDTVAMAQHQFAEIIETVNKKLIPKINDIAQGVLKVVASIIEDISSLVFAYLGKVSVFIEAHTAEIDQITTSIAAVVQEISRVIYKVVHEASSAVSKEWEDISEKVKSSHIAEKIKAQYEQFVANVEVSTAVINAVREAVKTIKDAVPSPDLKRLVTIIGEYIEKKLKRESVDDVGTIRIIIQSIIDIVNKVIRGHYPSTDSHLISRPVPPLSLDIIRKLPMLVSPKLSPLSYLYYGDIPKLEELFYGLSLNPEHWMIPHKLEGIIVQGQHIFTLDGKHITFPGNCNYLLARDAVNGNFSIAMTLTNGFLTAITLADKTDTVTVRKGGQVLLNNGGTEFPIYKPQLEAYRLYNSFRIWSKAGAEINCDIDLFVCGFTISGFYHGQLRGLLGNGNSEPYDDYTLPNGKIVSSESDFGNSYKMKGSCAAVTTVDHSVHHHDPGCNQLFGHGSPFRMCYKFVNPENYRIACDHGKAAGVPDTEFAIAAGYVASCRAKNIPISIPAEFAKCKNGPQVYSVGDTFSVKVPAKSADIVVIIDQDKANEVVFKELVQPTLNHITTELNSKGISDVEFHLIGYGGENVHHPYHHTVSGKLTFKGKCPHLKFYETPGSKPDTKLSKEESNVIEVIQELYKQLKLATGRTLPQRAFIEAFKYPFRADAVKSLIVFNSKPCEEGYLVGLQKLRAHMYANKQISVNLITPFDYFNAKDAKHAKNVIGFDAQHVFTFSEAKKKPEGSSDLYDDLEYNNYCVESVAKHNGNVFHVNNFLDAKGAARKQFVQVVSHNIVNKMIQVEQGLDCECKLVSAYSARNVCEVAYTKERIIPGKKGGHKG